MPPRRKQFKFQLDRTRRTKPSVLETTENDNNNNKTENEPSEEILGKKDREDVVNSNDDDNDDDSDDDDDEESAPPSDDDNDSNYTISSSSTSEQEESVADDDEDEIALSQWNRRRKKSPAAAKSKTKTTTIRASKNNRTKSTTRRNRTQEKSKEEQEEDDDNINSDGSEYAPEIRKDHRRKKSNTTRKPEKDDDEEEDDDDDIPLVSPSSRRSNSSRRRVIQDEEEDDEEDPSETNGESRRRRHQVNQKLRKSPRKATQQQVIPTCNNTTTDSDDNDDDKNTNDDDGDDGEEEIDDNVPLPMISKKKKKKKHDDSDDDYSGGSDLSDEDEESDLALEDEDEDEDSILGQDNEEVLEDHDEIGKPKAVDIDNEQIGSAEDSSSDNNSDKKEQQQPPTTTTKNKETPTRLLSPAAGRRRAEIRPSQSTLSSDEESSFDNNNDDDDDSNQHRKRRSFPVCPSTEDVITLAPLPTRHICVISPDGDSRQCFALETLRMTALKCFNNNIRVDNAGVTHKNFLQPPHFRTAMSDDLLDQIASKFGNEATDPEGSYYNRKNNIQDYFGTTDDPSDISGDDERRRYSYHDEEDFMDRVNGYLKRQMGSQDIYTCPLCYSEVHYRFNQIDVNVKKDDYHVTDRHDPMAVLGYLDNDRFEIASLFCFKRIAQLKKHLQNDHGVDTRGVQGSELYKKFQVRASDGLLQRWIRKSWGSAGGMQTYWFSGYNQSYLYLLNEMKKAEEYKERLASGADDSSDEEAEAYVAKAQKFFKSFEDGVQQAWDEISAPFRRNNDDIRDFLADDEDEEVDNEQAHFVARRAIEGDDEGDQNDFASKLARKYAEKPMSDEESSLDEDLRAPSDDSEADGSVEEIRGYYSEEEPETDQWMLDRQQARKLKRSRQQEEIEPAVEDSPVVGKRLKKRKGAPKTPSPPSKDHSTERKNAELQRTTSSKKRRVAVLEESSSSSSDEELEVA
eukprot:scaffold1618_cov109-Cylindrotheca_fusiformis.AAC.1